MNITLTLSGCSHPGTAREKNDDSYCVANAVLGSEALLQTVDGDDSPFQEFGLLCAVADGMGGYVGGEVASRTLLESLSQAFYSSPHRGMNANELRQCLEADVAKAKAALNAVLVEKGLEEAGTTLAGLALLPPDIAVIFHCGDSRVLRGSGGYVRSLTVDHTPLADEIASGRLDEAGAAHSPLATKVTRAIGLVGNTEVEFCADIQWEAGDTFLLATDGFAGLGRGLTVAALRRFIYQRQQDEEWAPLTEHARELVERAVAEDGSDNTTLVLIDIRAE